MLIRQSAAYLVANGCTAALGFVAVIVFTQLLTPAEFGVYVIANSMGAIVSALLFTWLRQSILRFEAEGGGADVRLTALAGFGLSIAVLPAGLLVLAYVVRLPWPTAAAAILFAATLALYDLGQELLRARLAARAYMIASVVRSVASLALAVAALKLGGGGLAVVGAVAAAYVLAALASARAVWRRPLKAFDSARLAEFVRFGTPITVSGLLFAVHMALDRLAVFKLLGPEAAGQYGASADFVRQCIIYPALSASLAIAPLAIRTFSQSGSDAARRHLVVAGELLLALILPAVAGIAVAAPDIAAVVFGPLYRASAQSLLPIIACAWLFQVMSQHYVHLSFNLAQRPALYIGHGLATLAVNAALMVPMVQAFGQQGAAYSLMIAEAAGLAAGWGLARRAFPLPGLGRALARTLLASAVMGVAAALVARAFAAPGIVSLLAVVATGLAVYAAAALALDLVGTRAIWRAAVPRGKELIAHLRKSIGRAAAALTWS